MADETLLEVDGLTVAFPTDEGLVEAVRGVSFTLEPGRVLGIAGESGSGKSVTTLAIMGLLPRSARVAGSVRFRGKELLGLSERALEEIRGRRISVIFQDPMTSPRRSRCIRTCRSGRRGRERSSCSSSSGSRARPSGPRAIRTSSPAGCSSGS
jgi:ABC-type glutathione transport system ATPase component